MAADAGHSAQTLSGPAQIRARTQDFGAALENLASLPGAWAETVAWGGSVFKREVDTQQEHHLDLYALLRRGAKHLDARRVREARLNAQELARHAAPLAELREVAAGWAHDDDDRVLVWTSLVGVNDSIVDATFRDLVTPDYSALRESVAAAWASAYELDLLEELARHSVRRFGLAVALSYLPSYRARGELFWEAPRGEAGETLSVARLLDEAGRGTWFDVHPGAPRNDSSSVTNLLDPAAVAWLEALPDGLWHAEFCLTESALNPIRVRRARAPDGPARWLAWDGEFDAAATDFGQSLLVHFERDIARPVLDRLGVRSKRQAPWLATHRGKPYINLRLLDSLADALDTSKTVLQALAGGPLEPVAAVDEQRFRAPRLLAELALLDSRLRSRVREFQARSLYHARWFEELDLAILPDDALPTTLGETRQFMDTAGSLYLEAELALVRALSGLAELESDGNQLELKHLFPTLIVDDELASVAHCEDLNAVLNALHADQAALDALRSDARSLLELPEGRAKRELAYYRQQHGFWTDAGANTSRERDEPAFLRVLLTIAPLPAAERARRRRDTLAARQAATRLLAGNNGWLGRQALNALLERISSFARMHETLRVTLVRSYSLLRQAILDAGRRLVRLNPELEPDAVWQLGFEELSSAVQYAHADLKSLVDERARRQRRRAQRPAPGRRLQDLTCTPSPPNLTSRILGAPTATGQFMGRVRKLAELSKERPLSSDDVLVGASFSASRSLIIGHAGAIVSASGGPLCHTAFVARQLGVPAVVGVGEAIEALDEGDEVLVDGSEGVLLRTVGGQVRS